MVICIIVNSGPCTVLAQADLHSARQLPGRTQEPKTAKEKYGCHLPIQEAKRAESLAGDCVWQLDSGTEHGLQLLSYLVQM